MDNAITFGAQAAQYASARPNYPDALFDWIALKSYKTDIALDVGTGSGQAALSLADRFIKVYATDIDQAQIAQAPRRLNITYMQSQAHETGLAQQSVDVITVATALHWFDIDLFWTEVGRIARPGGLFCAWTYHRAKVDEETDEYLMKPMLEILKPYWSDGNRLSWRGYTKVELNMPFDTISAPDFACDLNWNSKQIVSYLRSWSAHKRARLDGHSEILAKIEKEAISSLGDTFRAFTLPLNILAARIN